LPNADAPRPADRYPPSVRRPPPEWLLVPVFALPALAAAALVLWARHDYFARIEPYRRDGEGAAVRWIAREPGRVGWIASEFAKSLPAPKETDDGWESFCHPAGGGFVRVEGAKAPHAGWELGGGYASGLRPKALADANVRLAIETGAAPGAQPGIDAGTAAFVALIASPDEAKLRGAPLRASTKLYLLRRRFDGKPAAEAEALATLADFESMAEAPGASLARGAHPAGGAVVLRGDTGFLVFPSRLAPKLPAYVVAEDDAGDVRLAWSPVATADAADVAWRGRLKVPLAGEWTLVLPHGDRWWESGSFTRWALPAALGCIAFLFVPAALTISLRRRRRLDEARARFINELAHDLRTPVTSLRLHAEMLSEGRVPKGEEARYLGVLGREAARLSSLLANLLDLSRLERGKREFEVQSLDVGEILGVAVEDFALIHPKRADDVTLDVAAGLSVSADRTALARCLANLLDNAGKFTAPGTAIRVSAERADGARVRIVVADDGPGIAAADRARVFKLYERGGAAAASGAPGTGVGLAVVRELVQGMGGRVTLHASPRGAAFEITLPEASHG
jgi:signal transduction histidine kinase